MPVTFAVLFMQNMLQDDRRLLNIINERYSGCKVGHWNEVAELLGGDKSSKSCRLRWENQLKPDINHAAFDQEEDAIVIEMQKSHGNKWAKIARTLTQHRLQMLIDSGELDQNPHCPFRRTDNQVKNRWHAVLQGGKGKKRKLQDSETETEADAGAEESKSHKRSRSSANSEESLEGPETPRTNEEAVSTRTTKKLRQTTVTSKPEPASSAVLEVPAVCEPFNFESLATIADTSLPGDAIRQEDSLSDDFKGLTQFLQDMFPELTDADFVTPTPSASLEASFQEAVFNTEHISHWVEPTLEEPCLWDSIDILEDPWFDQQGFDVTML